MSSSSPIVLSGWKTGYLPMDGVSMPKRLDLSMRISVESKGLRLLLELL